MASKTFEQLTGQVFIKQHNGNTAVYQRIDRINTFARVENGKVYPRDFTPAEQEAVAKEFTYIQNFLSKLKYHNLYVQIDPEFVKRGL